MTPVSAATDERNSVTRWRDLLTTHARIWCELDRHLHEFGLTASAFEVLDRLVDAEHHKLRAQELADTTHLSQSALSRLVTQLEKEELVCRAMCDLDRRGIYVALTDAGIARHAEARPTHRAIVAALTDRAD